MSCYKLTYLAAALLCAPAARAQTAPAAWSKLEFLLGKWTGIAGEKDTQLGAGQGSFSFDLQLNGKVVVRHNNATYNSGITHDDLMVIYLDSPNDTPRAIYFDSEGHVIRYDVSFPTSGKAVFESDSHQPGPAYRLTYWIERGVLNGKFEVAPPDADYKNYMSWTAKKPA